MKRRWMSLLAAGLLPALLLGACAQKGGSASSDGRVSVSVTFNAMAEFVQAVGGDHVHVSTIIPDGTEPHDFEPKANDLVALSSAKVFVYNGLDMEKWATKAVSAAKNKNLVTVEASKGAEPIAAAANSEEAGQDDPHLWISLKGAQLEAQNIADGLKKADPANANDYDANLKTFDGKLGALYDEYAAKFAAAPKKDFVTGHAAFAYLCRDFGLAQQSVEDVFASGEPSAARLAELVDFCKKNKVTTVFSEEMVSPAVSKTLAQEAGAKVETIYTIESREDNKDYLTRMEDNLKKIADSLQA